MMQRFAEAFPVTEPQKAKKNLIVIVNFVENIATAEK